MAFGRQIYSPISSLEFDTGANNFYYNIDVVDIEHWHVPTLCFFWYVTSFRSYDPPKILKRLDAINKRSVYTFDDVFKK